MKLDNPAQHLMNSFIGELVARSWLERPILWMLEHWFFPVSRLWAAARSAGSDVPEFFKAVPMSSSGIETGRIKTHLRRFGDKRQQILTTEHQWQQTFFSESEIGSQALTQLESDRRSHRDQYNATRRGFFHLRKRVTMSVRENFAWPEELEAVYGLDEAGFEALFSPPVEMPEIILSHAIPTRYGRDFWLRFDSPSRRTNDVVYARVLEPAGVENPPTLIFGHGIGVEFDHWRNLVDIVPFFTQLGIRVIRPEGPWHGRRVPDGYYGGEYFLSRSPIGAFDFFSSQHQEWAVLIDWARRTSSGPLILGGSSLGAMSAQMTSIRANHWPSRYQPDAMFLMTHCSHVWEVALDGSLADIWGLHDPLKAHGWDRHLLETWLHRLDPTGRPCVPGERIVSVLGRKDSVTPFASGKRQQALWNLPPENCFNWPCGHFTVPLRMSRHHEPMLLLKQILDSIPT